MKNLIKWQLILLVCIVCACTEDDENRSAEYYLTKDSWVTEFTERVIYVDDALNRIDTIENFLNSVYTFYDDGTFHYTDVEIRSYADSIFEGSWVLSGDKDFLFTTGSLSFTVEDTIWGGSRGWHYDFNVCQEIIELNETKLTLRLDTVHYSIDPLVDMIYISYFKH